VREAKVDEAPFANEIVLCKWFPVVGDEGEGTAYTRFPIAGFCKFLFFALYLFRLFTPKVPNEA